MGTNALVDVITLQDGLDADGTYKLHLMSNQPITRDVPPGARVYSAQECGTYVLRAAWPYRGPCEIVCPEYDWRRVVVLWSLEAGQRIREQAVEAARAYFDEFGAWPSTTWLGTWPEGLDLETMIKLPFEAEEEVETLMAVCEAEFVPRGCLAVGRPGVQPE